jgi:hypothetical protein
MHKNKINELSLVEKIRLVKIGGEKMPGNLKYYY